MHVANGMFLSLDYLNAPLSQAISISYLHISVSLLESWSLSLTTPDEMALSRNIAAVSLVLFSLLLLRLTQAEELISFSGGAPSPSRQAQPIDCGLACQRRCKLSKRPNLCKRAYGSCCAKCYSVPPGTAGNYEACPCYAQLITRYKIRKCP